MSRDIYFSETADGTGSMCLVIDGISYNLAEYEGESTDLAVRLIEEHELTADEIYSITNALNYLYEYIRVNMQLDLVDYELNADIQL